MKPNELDREQWNRLPSVFARLKKDELGYPPVEWEELKAEEVGCENQYQLKNVPFYSRDLAYGDIVRVGRSAEGYARVVIEVLSRSGYSTIRLMISPTEGRDGIIDDFTHHGCILEFHGSLVTIGVPRESLDLVADYVLAEKVAGRWDAEDGFIAHD